jgi:hypothetical protein
VIFLEYSRMFVILLPCFRMSNLPSTKKLRICGFGESGVKGRTRSISENLPISKEFFFHVCLLWNSYICRVNWKKEEFKDRRQFLFSFLTAVSPVPSTFFSKEMKDYFKEFKTASIECIDGRCKQMDRQYFKI